MSAASLALGLAVVVLLLAVSIHLVMPHYLLMAVRVAASELTPWLIALAAVAAATAVATLGTDHVAPRLALGAAALAAILAAIPLARAPGVIADVDAQLRPAFGDARGERPAFSLVAAFTGLRVPVAAVTKDIPFRTAGAALYLDRYTPDRGTARPAAIVVHGGSWRGGDKGSSLTSSTEWSSALAARGFVVYDIQYRLAPASRHPEPFFDVLCALGHVRAHATEDGVDPERVVLVGRSAGAHLALLAAYRARERTECGPPARVRGVVALYGPTDLLAAYADPGDPDLIDGRAVLRDFLGGTPDEVGDRYRDAMPRNWLDGAVPTLLIHGDADEIVYPRHSEDLAARLRERAVPVVFLRLPWSGHGFDALGGGVGGQIALATTERFVTAVVAAR